MRLTRVLLGSTMVAALLVLPASAVATIEPQRGMLGVRLGMTASQVQARLGPPSAIRRPTIPIVGRVIEHRYGEVRVWYFSFDQRAFNFFTRGRTARTLQGVGVGTPERYLRTALRGETCRTEFGVRHCFFGLFNPGRIITDFRISRGRVSSVTVGRVID